MNWQFNESWHVGVAAEAIVTALFGHYQFRYGISEQRQSLTFAPLLSMRAQAASFASSLCGLGPTTKVSISTCSAWSLGRIRSGNPIYGISVELPCRIDTVFCQAGVSVWIALHSASSENLGCFRAAPYKLTTEASITARNSASILLTIRVLSVSLRSLTSLPGVAGAVQVFG